MEPEISTTPAWPQVKVLRTMAFGEENRRLDLESSILPGRSLIMMNS
jgi:hypothetical protein